MRKCGIAVVIISFFLINNFCFANQNKRIIKVVTSPDYQPFSFYKDGKLSGLEIDLLSLIEKNSDFKFEIHTIDFNGIIAGVNSGKFDMAISGISKTASRMKNVDFSVDYYSNKISIISKKNTGEFINIVDLSGKIIGVQSGTEAEKLLNEKFNNSETEIISISNNSSLISMLESDKIEMIVADKFFIDSIIANLANIFSSVIKRENGEEIIVNFAIIFNKKFEYSQQISSIVSELIANGEIDKLKNKWLIQNKKNELDLVKRYLWVCSGAIYTLSYTVFAFILSFFISLFLTFARYSDIKLFKMFVSIYVSIIRGTPLLLQLSILYFIIPQIFKINLSVFNACVAALAINSSAYLAEIFRSGVQSIHYSQFEIAINLNFTKLQMYRDIIIPQVLKRNVPNFLNEIISLIKESSIVSFIGGVDIMKRANIVAMEKYDYFGPLLVAGFTYYIISFSLEMLVKVVEKRNFAI